MAQNAQLYGPQIGQIVLYNNGGTITAAIIYAIVSASAQTVSLLFLGSPTPLTNVPSSAFSANPQVTSGTWGWPAFF
jgi:hypothetical protein